MKLSITNVRAFLQTYGIEYASEGALTVKEQEQYLAIAQLYHEVPTTIAYLGLGNTNLLPAKFLAAINDAGEPVEPEEPTLVSIAIEPNPIVATLEGDPVAFTATGTYSDETTATLDTGTATIQNEEIAAIVDGQVMGLSAGETTLSLTIDEITGTATVQIDAL